MRDDILVDSLFHMRVSGQTSLGDYRRAAGAHAVKPVHAISAVLFLQDLNEIWLHPSRTDLTPRLNRRTPARSEANEGHILRSVPASLMPPYPKRRRMFLVIFSTCGSPLASTRDQSVVAAVK